MSLLIRSSINALHEIALDTAAAGRVCAALAGEGRSFYCEPWPRGRSRIYCDREHAARVLELAGDGARLRFVPGDDL